MDESERQVIDPLQVVYREQQRAGRGERSMRCLEDPEWIS